MNKKILKDLNGGFSNSTIGIVVIVLLVVIIAFLLYIDGAVQRKGIAQLQADLALKKEIEQENYKQIEEEKRFNEAKDGEFRIVCWGDNLANKDGQFSFTTELQNMFNDKGYDASVVDMNISGEDTKSVMVRAGALNMLTDEEFTIPEDKLEVEVKFHIEDDSEVTYLKGEKNYSSVRIGGIWGILTYEKEADVYKFRRDTAGVKLRVLPGTPIITRESEEFKDYFPIIAVGTNGGWNGDIYELIGQQQKILDAVTMNQSSFLILGFTRLGDLYTENELAGFEAPLQSQWGDHFLNMRLYLSNEDMLKSADIVLEGDDITKALVGCVPQCIKSDDLNLNEDGAKIAGQLIFHIMERLDYLPEK